VKYRPFLFCVLVAGLTLAYTGALAQNQPNPPVEKPLQPRPGTNVFPLVNRPDTLGGETNRRIMIARQLMQTQNFTAAADMLQPVNEQEPDNQVVISMLRNCYFQLKQFARAEILVLRQLAKDQNNLGAWLDLAELKADQGQADSSKWAYQEARKRLDPADTIRVLTFLRSQISRSMDTEAAGLLDSLRRQRKDSMMFGLERGQLYEHARDYKGAVREYVPLMKSDTDFVTMEAQRRLTALLEFSDSRVAIESALLAMEKNSSNQYLARLMTDHYIRSDQFDKAYEFAIKRDSLAGLKGSSLIYFMRQCHDRKLYAQVVRLGDYVLSHYGNGPAYVDASLSYADALAHLGKNSEAIARYDQIIVTSQRPQDKGEALLQIGMLYFDYVKDYSKALVYFDSVVNHYQMGYSFIGAKRMRPYCFIRLGKRGDARVALAEMKAQPTMDELNEEVTFQLAMLNFYDQAYDSASAGLRKLIVDYPRGFYVNDAIQILAAMDDTKEKPELRPDFATALAYDDEEKYDSCRTWLDRVARVEDSPIADDALFRLSEVCLKLSDSTGALESIDRLTDGFPDSYFIPYGLKQKADILCSRPDRVSEGREIYKRILERYPNYPLASEVRKRLRTLETDQKIG
jgi:tetratricopeptide (TPR) repeat protein